MRPNQVVDSVQGVLFPQFVAERRRLREIDRWYRWNPNPVSVPRRSSPEHRALAELARTPWLGLVVAVCAQTMIVDGYKEPDVKANSAAWRTWQANKFDARHIAINKAALAYGYAFGTALPGDLNGTPTASLRGVSPLNMTALYNDPAEDDYPTLAMRVYEDQPGGTVAIRVYDEENVYYLSADQSGNAVKYLSNETHGVGVCPVVRFAPSLDLQGRCAGEVEPFIPIAARINKTDYDRLLTQHFASWKVRYVTGMSKPENDNEQSAAKMRLRQDDILVAEVADAKFGTLDASPLDGFIAAKKDDIETLAAVSQTPTAALTGDLINLSAEALASARAQLDQKVNERKVTLGESYATLLRLAAHVEGNTAAADDVMSRVTWQDMSIRSFAQAVDALGKAATMLQVPVRALWPLIPGVTKSDVDDWTDMAKAADPLSALNAKLDAAAEAAAATPPAA